MSSLSGTKDTKPHKTDNLNIDNKLQREQLLGSASVLLQQPRDQWVGREEGMDMTVLPGDRAWRVTVKSLDCALSFFSLERYGAEE